MRTWEQAVKEHLQLLEEHGYKDKGLLGVFCYGSQNYGVATPDSDWDTVAIIVPSFTDLVMQHHPTSIELHLNNGEHCVVKDIREIVKMWRQQNINFIEILFTQYKWINPFYERIWHKVLIYKEEIATYDINKTIQSITGQALHTLSYKKLDNKKIANAYRFMRFLECIFTEPNYIDRLVLPAKDRQKIIEMKQGGHIEPYTVTKIKEKIRWMQSVTVKQNMEIQEATHKIMVDLQLDIIAARVYNEDEY